MNKETWQIIIAWAVMWLAGLAIMAVGIICLVSFVLAVWSLNKLALLAGLTILFGIMTGRLLYGCIEWAYKHIYKQRHGKTKQGRG